MNTRTGFTRRSAIRAGLAVVAAPAVLRYARGETPIKIGMPLALTGPAGEIGLQMRHGAEFWAKQVNAKGGLTGRQIELHVEDTARRSRNLRAQGAACCGTRQLPFAVRHGAVV